MNKIIPEKRIKLIALIAQIEFGDYNEESFDLKLIYQRWIEILFNNNNNNVKRKFKYKMPGVIFDKNDPILMEHLPEIIFWHKKFSTLRTNHCKCLFIKEALEIDEIGVDYFTVTSNKKTVSVGIGHRGISIHSNNETKL